MKPIIILVILLCNIGPHRDPMGPIQGAAYASRNRLSLTIFLVPEKVACSPDGYTAYDSNNIGSGQPCEPLNMNIIESWKRDRLYHEIHNIPPSKINITNRLKEMLDTYSSIGRGGDPANGKAIVMVFKWEKPLHSKITLRRRSHFRCSIPNLDWQGNSQGWLHWIHHERADSLLPSQGLYWTLTTEVDRKVWIFYTGDSGEG